MDSLSLLPKLVCMKWKCLCIYGFCINSDGPHNGKANDPLIAGPYAWLLDMFQFHAGPSVSFCSSKVRLHVQFGNLAFGIPNDFQQCRSSTGSFSLLNCSSIGLWSQFVKVWWPCTNLHTVDTSTSSHCIIGLVATSRNISTGTWMCPNFLVTSCALVVRKVCLYWHSSD